MNLPPELDSIRLRIRSLAEEQGLDFFETIFEILDYKAINQVAAYGGYPTRYPHWRFGMEYEHLSKSYSYGLHKIYEMVINNDPAYAYLLEGNALVDQKLVMAHVYGHVDFFKNNFSFAPTNRKMMDQMANHATRVRRYIDKYGLETVEEFIDTCLSLENLVDVHAPFMARRSSQAAEEETQTPVTVRQIASKEYMRSYINPPEFLEAEKKKLEAAREKRQRFPEEPSRDVLDFLRNYAPLQEWERDVLSIIRDEAYYFSPQAQTKIMNEGWATYWHAKLMTQYIMDDSEVVDFADHHSRTMGGSSVRVNPYKLGYELFKDIEQRWNKGRFGKDFESCDDLVERDAWNTETNMGREKIFEVRRFYNDVTFIDAFLNEDFCHHHKMFMYSYEPKTGHYHIRTRNFAAVKQAFLSQLTNLGNPLIEVIDANHANRGELLLVHRHAGIDLKQDEAKETLRALYKVWKRPVRIQTTIDKKGKMLVFDGTDHQEEDTDEADSKAAGDGTNGDAATSGES